jgi:hypothetical protein
MSEFITDLLGFRNWLADRLEEFGGFVLNRGMLLKGQPQADILVRAPDGTLLEITIKEADDDGD